MTSCAKKCIILTKRKMTSGGEEKGVNSRRKKQPVLASENVPSGGNGHMSGSKQVRQ